MGKCRQVAGRERTSPGSVRDSGLTCMELQANPTFYVCWEQSASDHTLLDAWTLWQNGLNRDRKGLGTHSHRLNGLQQFFKKKKNTSFYVFILARPWACGILVPQLGINRWPLHWKCSLNCWTIREAAQQFLTMLPTWLPELKLALQPY